MKRYLFALAGLALLVGTGRFAALAIDADPNQKYEVTPAAGPWMILASSYTGPQAAELSHELVLDIRHSYNLPAFVFNHGAEERRQQLERIRLIKEQNPDARLHEVRIEEQIAVLVGGYKDMESARKALDDFKKLKPTIKKVMPKITTTREAVQDGQKGIMIETGYVNPFLTSFVVRNPSVPPEQVQRDKGPDPFLKKLNEDETYSIYQCRKPWTLAVAIFQSPTVIETQATSRFLGKLVGGDAAADRLSAAAMNAHSLAELIRTKWNMKAYVFHTRNNSVVTIEGFDAKDDPQLVRLAQGLRFCDQSKQAPSGFLANPLPMEVPK